MCFLELQEAVCQDRSEEKRRRLLRSERYLCPGPTEPTGRGKDLDVYFVRWEPSQGFEQRNVMIRFVLYNFTPATVLEMV